MYFVGGFFFRYTQKYTPIARKIILIIFLFKKDFSWFICRTFGPLLYRIMSINSKILGLRVAGTIFGLVAVLNLLRVVTGVTIVIAGWMLPMWVNVLGFAGSGLICVWLWLLSVSRGR